MRKASTRSLERTAPLRRECGEGCQRQTPPPAAARAPSQHDWSALSIGPVPSMSLPHCASLRRGASASPAASHAAAASPYVTGHRARCCVRTSVVASTNVSHRAPLYPSSHTQTPQSGQ